MSFAPKFERFFERFSSQLCFVICGGFGNGLRSKEFETVHQSTGEQLDQWTVFGESPESPERMK